VAEETRHKILDMLTLGESLLLTLAAHRTQTGHALHGRIGQYTMSHVGSLHCVACRVTTLYLLNVKP